MIAQAIWMAFPLLAPRARPRHPGRRRDYGQDLADKLARDVRTVIGCGALQGVRGKLHWATA